MKNSVKKTWNVISTILVVIVVVIALLLVGARVFGLQVYAVLSGSMEPTYHVGSIIYVKPVDPSELKVGDPITFVMNEQLTVATHRVVRIDAENSAFYTKGDANEDPDASPVHFNNLLGKPVFTIPYLGYVSSYVPSRPSMSSSRPSPLTPTMSGSTTAKATMLPTAAASPARSHGRTRTATM